MRLVRGYVAITKRPKEALVGAGYVRGVPRLGIPELFETDASLGVANQADTRKGDVATALPAGLATAASFDVQAAYDAGAMIGSEARSKGYNVMLAGGVNLTREPRNGRNFEYLGEDPWLAGKIGGATIRGIQSNAIASTVKHFALNAQETGRMVLSARIDEAALRESDLLAFQLAIEDGRPASVMCAYNRVNGRYACEDEFLLTQVLKQDWKYPGWVMSDWVALHNTMDALVAGLDQESGMEFDTEIHWGQPLAAALERGDVKESRIDAMVHRILRSIIAVGIVDKPVAAPSTNIDYAAHARVAQRVAEEGAVLLKNEILPLAPDVKRVVLIGGHADVGVLSGGGSSQVRAAAGTPIQIPMYEGAYFCVTYHGSSPLAALRARLPNAEITYDDGSDAKRAAKVAKGADVAIVFATKWAVEGTDARDLRLEDGQDALIEAVAKSNRRTVVVLETGNPVLMPWLDRVGAVLEVWYPGEAGGEAIARLLLGEVNPSGHLPITFPAGERQLPRPKLDGLAEALRAGPQADATKLQPFEVKYVEGADVGYRWFAAKKTKPLFPFGFGLSYTRFALEGLKSDGTHVELDVVNTGGRAGVAVPQIYATPPGGQARLVGFARVELAPSERKHVSVEVDPRLLARYDTAARGWHVTAGAYTYTAAQHASDKGVTTRVKLSDQRLPP
ncbi:MAG TPA: beta-glucosidase [Myxococcota bacterium]|nr:beta-glucosidase [Myxococcota bacterium]